MSSPRLGTGKLVIATHNAGKLKEIQALLAPYGIECLSAGALGLPEPAETGTTFVENALIKARAAAEASQIPALADDSGLCVDALGGAPGVYTADWAEADVFEGGPGRDWYMAMGKVEGKLAGVEAEFARVAAESGESAPELERGCHFACVLAIAWPDGSHAVYEGRAHGTLTWPPRGTMGFGYDPVFVPVGDTRTFAELDPAEKHAISHRADAFAKLVADQFSA
ncbi:MULTISPECIES: RdgB/HAM1 family non-canonical purine NTP pyrophosphatase [Novosphingobium]|jgi:XTP/dITP diphosphohydrolase|uniref:dITP/XTP pyrophosphatase n=1 Tax=Novosphingobium subterraneum TaxID=48936 RepID=A0A0B8ZS40_9SPHN|nr:MULTISPECIES: RdgB/HAM1 family non-canonical purine NTP pyrophosphatase [Novosphingobium]KHS49019.1 deoxyribonucleotide triphosphate pyrophosphatase [Novosphingobium subterraneum]QOV95127.1 RdgB/HAM1 family non-canonical purine NTP pyrophosphatase [Novosphingobium sp. ES2-1]